MLKKKKSYTSGTSISSGNRPTKLKLGNTLENDNLDINIHFFHLNFQVKCLKLKIRIVSI